MTEPTESRPKADPRKSRLAQALRDNLRRRKAQARRRAAGESPSGDAPASPPHGSKPDDSRES